MRYAMVVLAMVMTAGVAQAGVSGGFDWPDLRVYHGANDDYGANGYVFLATPYKITDFGTSFHTAWDDPTRYTWTAKCNVELITGYISSSLSDSVSVSRRGYAYNSYANANWGTEGDEGHWNYFSAQFYLDPATVTNARFTWNEYFPEWSPNGYAYGLYEVSGFLKGERAAEFGSNFQMAAPVPEPTTMSLLGLGGLAFLRRRRR